MGEGNIDCIPNTEEKYISFSKSIQDEEGKLKHKLRFLDSFKFMASSLDKRVNNLKPEQFENVKKHFDVNFDTLLRKGVFLYDCFNSLEKLNETHLPPKEAFHSKLNNSNITDDDFEHALKVWEHFKMTTFREYHDLYMKLNVLLLTDVFENFRSVCLKNYGFDPCWYFTTPGLAWDACLKKTDVKLKLLNDVDMLLKFEKGIRGGVSMIPKRYAKANNKYMKDFNLEEESRFFQYLDANNLYGWAMSQPLLVSNFKWMTESHLENWREISSQEGCGCILEVDLEHPKELDDLHNNYPLAPERIVVNKVEKLIPTLRKKDKYVLHHRNLKQYLEMGMNLMKIHRGISFAEDAWLKPYIELNTKLRTAAFSEFEKDFFKLMNNSVLEKPWRTFETGWISDSERMINQLKSLFRNRIMNERQSSLKILSQCT